MTSSSIGVRVGVVIPTLGKRPELIGRTLKSVRDAGNVFCLLVRPRGVEIETGIQVDDEVDDPGLGLAAAINFGIASLPRDIEVVTWLGDDDLLAPNSLLVTTSALLKTDAAFVWGRCRYIDKNDNLIMENRSGKWAVQLMKFGPNLLPQPGSLLRRSSFDSIGGLDTRYRWAFDQDLFVRLSEIYRYEYVDTTVASFRWHDSSLSVGSRRGSVRESSRIRRRGYPVWASILVLIWEPLISTAIYVAGAVVSRRKAV